jgi:LmbE family N-acetylglucosaminyl deacetylase
MNLHLDTAEIHVPDGLPPAEALGRTTHLGVGAHPDDLEILAMDGILRCFHKTDEWFAGVVVTNGAGSPRSGRYRDHTDAMMGEVRRREQRKAAHVGAYAAVAFLDYPSAAVKSPKDARAQEDLAAILSITGPTTVYTHNLADRHDTHVAVALRTIAAIRSLPQDRRPRRLYGCEAWRDLDWLADSDKVVFDLSAHEGLQAALIGVFDSQISGGKRYDLATRGRQQAHATYHASHRTDAATSLGYAMDMTPLIVDPTLRPQRYLAGLVGRFVAETEARLARLEAAPR